MVTVTTYHRGRSPTRATMAVEGAVSEPRPRQSVLMLEYSVNVSLRFRVVSSCLLYVDFGDSSEFFLLLKMYCGSPVTYQCPVVHRDGDKVQDGPRESGGRSQFLGG